MSTRTAKTKVVGRLAYVRKEYGKFRFTLKDCDVGPKVQTFLLSEEKALTIANSDEAFPVGVPIEALGRFEEKYGGENIRNLIHVKILSVDGVETLAWSERVGSTQVDPAVIVAGGPRDAGRPVYPVAGGVHGRIAGFFSLPLFHLPLRRRNPFKRLMIPLPAIMMVDVLSELGIAFAW